MIKSRNLINWLIVADQVRFELAIWNCIARAQERRKTAIPVVTRTSENVQCHMALNSRFRPRRTRAVSIERVITGCNLAPLRSTIQRSLRQARAA